VRDRSDASKVQRHLVSLFGLGLSRTNHNGVVSGTVARFFCYPEFPVRPARPSILNVARLPSRTPEHPNPGIESTGSDENSSTVDPANLLPGSALDLRINGDSTDPWIPTFRNRVKRGFEEHKSPFVLTRSSPVFCPDLLLNF
jgi:hypothetical protein